MYLHAVVQGDTRYPLNDFEWRFWSSQCGLTLAYFVYTVRVISHTVDVGQAGNQSACESSHSNSTPVATLDVHLHGRLSIMYSIPSLVQYLLVTCIMLSVMEIIFLAVFVVLHSPSK